MTRTGYYYRTLLSSGFDEVEMDFVTQIVGNALFVGVTATFEFGVEVKTAVEELKERLQLRARHPLALTINVSPLFEQQGLLTLSIQKVTHHGHAISYEILDDLVYCFEYVVCSSPIERHAKVLLVSPMAKDYLLRKQLTLGAEPFSNTVFCTGTRN